jgi:tetratricopeptide (TPR) repeat protein
MRCLIILLSAILLAGCGTQGKVTWASGWTVPASSVVVPATPADRARAQHLSDTADSAESIRLALEAWESVAAAHPNEEEPWAELGTLWLLEGAAFRKDGTARLLCYRKALQACERAMATNPEFMRRIQSGQPMEKSIEALGAGDMKAMQFWSTSVFYIYRDCLGFYGRILNYRLMQRAKAVLERMDSVDPAWEDHATTFSWGIYYLAMPSSLGGDKDKAGVLLDRAVAMGPQRLLPRWGRGKYYHPERGDWQAARADLEAVSAADLAGLRGHPAWNRYFKAEAVSLLSEHGRSVTAR